MEPYAPATVQVVIAGRNKVAADQLTTVVAHQERCQVRATVYTGSDVLTAVSAYVPDVVVLDLVLPDLDGLELVGQVQSIARRPKIIILAEQALERWAMLALEHGADYVLLRPVADQVVASRILQVAEVVPPTPMPTSPITADLGPAAMTPQYITKLLLQLGVPAHLNGYHYLRDSIAWLLSQGPGPRIPVTKELYPVLADRFRTRPTRVERGVRHAIEVAWSRGDRAALDKLFGHSINRYSGRPTNSEFIYRLVDAIREVAG